MTLMFSMGHYEAVARAYVKGLERCATPAKVASVASFFVSRVDTMVDKDLEKIGTREAKASLGKIAIANSKVVYRRFMEIFHGEGFAALRQPRRARAAASVGEHGNQESGLLRCALRRELDRPGNRQYVAARYHQRFSRSRQDSRHDRQNGF